MKPLRVCQVVANINRDVGGPAVSVSRLADVLAQQEVLSRLVTLDYPHHGPQEKMASATACSMPSGVCVRLSRGFSPALKRRLFDLAADGMDIIHNHGLWMFPNWYARQTAVRFMIPLVISPRGMVENWSLRRSRFKKFVFWHLFERTNLLAARVFHATSKSESISIRRLGFHQPIATISNGVDLPDLSLRQPRELLEKKFPALKRKRWLLFLSRLHPKKGVVELLQVWRQLEGRFPDWQLVLAGPDLDGYGKKVRLQAASLGLNARVTFTGMVSGGEKLAALSNADLFVLPTHSENFGIVIAEALACGVPVVTTKAAPWHDLQLHQCGWWIDDNAASARATLESAMGLAAEDRVAMGRRGRDLVERGYSWHHVGEQMLAVYKWCVGGGEPPACVETT